MRQKDYLDTLIDDSVANDPGFAETWKPYQAILDLIDRRQELGLSQVEVAKRMRVDKRRISEIENHPATVSFGRISAYAAALGAGLQVVAEESASYPTTSRTKRTRS
jgi:ribosome-binding protein aMBF1 (putative translation factor)